MSPPPQSRTRPSSSSSPCFPAEEHSRPLSIRSNGGHGCCSHRAPAPADPPRRASPPFLAALVPVVAGVLLWAISGSAFALCFALLGPLMLGASLLDGVRSRRREHRRARAEEAEAWEQAELELGRRHVEERGRLRLLHPDAASALAQRPLRGAQSPNAETAVVLGGGSVPSAVHSTGGTENGPAPSGRGAGSSTTPRSRCRSGAACAFADRHRWSTRRPVPSSRSSACVSAPHSSPWWARCARTAGSRTSRMREP